jgi:hypothetical protein
MLFCLQQELHLHILDLQFNGDKEHKMQPQNMHESRHMSVNQTYAYLHFTYITATCNFQF